ncbi:MAG: carboxypeptidase-like regulatory domain-containing protein [Cyclobacteriaceae bacterium]
MTSLSRLCKILVFLLISLDALGQTNSLIGKVIDAKTDEPIPFANIGALNTSKGTSSNINGEFILRIDSLPQEIYFSHLNYLKRAIRVAENNVLVVKLTPVDNVLDAIIVQGRKRNDYIIDMITRAYNKALFSSRKNYGKAFYRQTSKNGSNYSELYEIFYDTKFSNIGIEDWEVQEGRYAMAASALANKNFTLLSRILTTIQPNTNDFILPINPMMEEYFDFNVLEVKKMDTREVAVINFIPTKKAKSPAFEGEVYIDINNYDILKVKGKIQNDALSIIKITGEGTWKNYVLNYELAYRESSDSLLLDYVSVNQVFDYYFDDQLVYPVDTKSQLTFYEYYQPKKNKRLGGKVRLRDSDAAVLDKIGYNREFWKENEIVKRTPVEQGVIESFESEKAFGTIYLNDQKQVVLEKNDVAKDSLVNAIQVKFEKKSLYQEKSYLHLDKPFYTAGERMWYSGYLVSAASHQQIDGSGVLYVDLIDPDGEVVESQNIKVSKGSAKGDILLSDKLPTGRYILRAYTRWMRNQHPDFFFQKDVMIYNENNQKESQNRPESDLSLNFFPEGGDILAGVITRIAFKAIDQSGNGADVNGQVLDGEGNRVGNFESIHQGMGSFFLNPRADTDYFAKVSGNGIERMYPLPYIQSAGMALQVQNNKENTVKIIVQASQEYNDRSCYIIGQNRGRIYTKSKGLLRKGKSIIELPKSRLPDGIFQITLFDDLGQPQCERLIFIDQQRDIDIQISPDKEELDSRGPSEFDIKLSDSEGRPVQGNFSVAVTDAQQFTKVTNEENIKSYLLLNSDIKGGLEEPGFYFKDREKETVRKLDLLMLTQGWRRFTWKDILSNRSTRLNFAMEKGLTLSGIVFDPYNDEPLESVDVSTLVLGASTTVADLVTTDEKGRFNIYNLDLPDSVSVLFNKISAKRKVSKVKVRLTSEKYLLAIKGTGDFLEQEEISQEELDYLSLDEQRRQIELAFGDEKVKFLDEVEIKGSKQSISRATSIHGTPDATIVSDPNMAFMNIFQMIQGRVAGVVVSGNNITIRNSPGPPFVLLDGVPIVEPSGSYFGGQQATTATTEAAAGEPAPTPPEPVAQNGNGIERLLSIPPTDVDRIEILKGPAAAIYGLRGANGVLAIYTKRGSANVVKESSKQAYSVMAKGYYTAREFYSPKYDQPLPEHARPDKRATLYWNPKISTDKNGKATFSFFNSDIGKKLQIDIQGVSNSGQTLYKLTSIGDEIE